MKFLKGLEAKVRQVRRELSPFLFAGSRFHCPICDLWYRKFRAAGRGDDRRLNAVCPKCAARERDRFVHCLLTTHPDRFLRDSLRMLHFAPELSLTPALQRLASGGWFSVDLVRHDVRMRIDIQSMPFRDSSFDAIYSSHILPEVPDDRRALAEMNRVLAPGGWILLLLPLTEGASRSVGEHRSQAQRKDAAPGTIRVYGRDTEQLIAAAGFRVERIDVAKLLNEEKQREMALSESRVGGVFLLTK